MLGMYRVLDLTDDRGHLAAFILGGLGAEVILVEPPEGSPARRIGPFAGGEEHPERSLTFWAWNRGKRSVVLDLTTDEGMAALRRLAATADVVISSDAHPVDLDELRAANPALVTVAITPVRRDGSEGRLARHRPDGHGRRLPAGHDR